MEGNGILYEDKHVKISVLPANSECHEVYVFHSDNTYLLQEGILKELCMEKRDSLAKRLFNLHPEMIPDILSSEEISNLSDFVIKPLREAYKAISESRKGA